ncbi:V-type ATP synthase subunit B, partial [Candidatus Dojkabacteria bacterium]|nr:V-type ATP synthase subunit B [Candidatus Dojkabacteria bacterium]
MQKWYTGTTELFQQIMIVDGVTAPLFDELVNIETADGRMLLGKVLIAEQGRAVVQVFSSADGLQKRGLRTHFTGHPLEFTVGKELLGRIFNGVGEVKDGGSKTWRGLKRAVQGSPINPVARDLPGEFIQT